MAVDNILMGRVAACSVEKILYRIPATIKNVMAAKNKLILEVVAH